MILHPKMIRLIPTGGIMIGKIKINGIETHKIGMGISVGEMIQTNGKTTRKTRITTTTIKINGKITKTTTKIVKRKL